MSFFFKAHQNYVNTFIILLHLKLIFLREFTDEVSIEIKRNKLSSLRINKLILILHSSVTFTLL